MNKIISIFGMFILFSVLGLSFCKGDGPDDKPPDSMSPDNMPPDNMPPGDISGIEGKPPRYDHASPYMDESDL